MMEEDRLDLGKITGDPESKEIHREDFEKTFITSSKERENLDGIWVPIHEHYLGILNNNASLADSIHHLLNMCILLLKGYTDGRINVNDLRFAQRTLTSMGSLYGIDAFEIFGRELWYTIESVVYDRKAKKVHLYSFLQKNYPEYLGGEHGDWLKSYPEVLPDKKDTHPPVLYAMKECDNCGRDIDEDLLRCPYCSTTLSPGIDCSNCGKLDTDHNTDGFTDDEGMHLKLCRLCNEMAIFVRDAGVTIDWDAFGITMQVLRHGSGDWPPFSFNPDENEKGIRFLDRYKDVAGSYKKEGPDLFE